MPVEIVKRVKAEVSEDGASVVVTFSYKPEYVLKIKDVPSRRFIAPEKPEGPGWRLNLDIATMRRLREQFGDELELGKELKRWGQEVVGQERNLTALSTANDAELTRVSKKLSKWLRPYQRADIKFMSEANVICANQPRTGKTSTLVGAMIEAGQEWGQHVVFAPKASLREVWEVEIKAVYAKQGLEEPVVLTGDDPQERREAIWEAKELADDGLAFWLVVNPAMCRAKEVETPQSKKHRKLNPDAEPDMYWKLEYPELAEIDWTSITVDEFHLMGLSNPNTQGAKGMNLIADMTKPDHKYALSGTPMGGKPIKLWGALHFLDPEEFTSRWNWARHWLVVNEGEYGSTIEGIMPGREIEFNDHLMSRLVRRVQKDALPGLPPVNRVNVWCPMTDRQRQQYEKMATEAEWIIEDAEQNQGRLSATNILALYTRLKQFADSYCEVSGGTGMDGKAQVRATTDSGKLEQLDEKLAECNVIVSKGKDEDEPAAALIFSQFNSVCDMVAEHLTELGVPNERIIAGKDKRNNAIVRSFQEGGPDAPRVLVMNTLGGTTLTLDRAESVHILDETWVPDNQEQAENRATPTTEEKMAARASTGAYYYRTRGSVEEYVQMLVKDKALNNKTILDLRDKLREAAELLGGVAA